MSANFHDRTRGKSRVSKGLLFLLLLVSMAWGAAVTPLQSSILPAQTIKAYSNPTGVFLDANLEPKLTSEMKDALEKGIDLYFLITVEIKRDRWYWFDATDAHRQKEMKLSYQPLLHQYRLTTGGLSQSMATLDEALSVLGYLSEWKVAEADVLDLSSNQTLFFTFEINHKKLPRIFQVGITQEEGWQLKIQREVSLSRKGLK